MLPPWCWCCSVWWRVWTFHCKKPPQLWWKCAVYLGIPSCISAWHIPPIGCFKKKNCKSTHTSPGSITSLVYSSITPSTITFIRLDLEVHTGAGLEEWADLFLPPMTCTSPCIAYLILFGYHFKAKHEHHFILVAQNLRQISSRRQTGWGGGPPAFTVSGSYQPFS